MERVATGEVLRCYREKIGSAALTAASECDKTVLAEAKKRQGGADSRVFMCRYLVSEAYETPSALSNKAGQREKVCRASPAKFRPKKIRALKSNKQTPCKILCEKNKNPGAAGLAGWPVGPIHRSDSKDRGRRENWAIHLFYRSNAKVSYTEWKVLSVYWRWGKKKKKGQRRESERRLPLRERAIFFP